MKKLLAGLLLGGALAAGTYLWFPTEARMADNELLRVEALSAQVDEQYLPVNAQVG